MKNADEELFTSKKLKAFKRRVTSVHGPIKFPKSSRLGEGTFGQVYKSKRYAYKIFKNNHVDSSVLREVSILAALSGCDAVYNHCIEMVELLRSQNKLIVKMNCAHATLEDYLKGKHEAKTEELSNSYMRQLALAVEFLHSVKIIHRDLKPNNILIMAENVLKITDFGESIQYIRSRCNTTCRGTLWWRSPEMLLGGTYDMTVDCWSLGCIFHELLLGSKAFTSDCEIDAIFRIFQKLGTPSKLTHGFLRNCDHFDDGIPYPKWTPTVFGSEILDATLKYPPRASSSDIVNMLKCDRALLCTYQDVAVDNTIEHNHWCLHMDEIERRLKSNRLTLPQSSIWISAICQIHRNDYAYFSGQMSNPEHFFELMQNVAQFYDSDGDFELNYGEESKKLIDSLGYDLSHCPFVMDVLDSSKSVNDFLQSMRSQNFPAVIEV